jgi:hypothetical protein
VTTTLFIAARLLALITIALASVAAQAAWQTYTSASLGYTISYPPGWRVRTDYQYDGMGADHPIAGVAFQIPASRTALTNLSDTSTQVSVESVSDTGNSVACSAARFLPDVQDARELTDGGRRWSVATAEDGAAGNLYTTIVYALLDHSPCVAVRYVIHSTNILNYTVGGTVTAFDGNALLADFDEIRHTLNVH